MVEIDRPRPPVPLATRLRAALRRRARETGSADPLDERPAPQPGVIGRALATGRGRLDDFIAATGPGRVASVALTLGLVGAGSWWLLHTPAPPVEAALPRAGTSSPATARVVPVVPVGGRSAVTTTEVAVAAVGQPVPTGSVVVVQVAGAVLHPGVYRLAPGARVGDLVAAAGGTVDGVDASVINLAAKLGDGQRVYVPRPGEAPALWATDTASTAPEPVDLNAATSEQLQSLPGVGPATAAAIIDYRTRHGGFRSIDELADVHGLGPAKLDVLRPLVRV